MARHITNALRSDDIFGVICPFSMDTNIVHAPSYVNSLHLVAVGKSFDRWFCAAERACRVSLHREDSEICFQRMVDHKSANEWRAFPQYEFECFRGLNQANLPGHNAQDPDVTSGRCHRGLRRSREHAAQARTPILGRKHTGLSFEPDGSPEDKGFACKECSVIE